MIAAYEKGDWTNAIRYIKELDALKLRDGPTENIRNFIINECKGELPEKW